MIPSSSQPAGVAAGAPPAPPPPMGGPPAPGYGAPPPRERERDREAMREAPRDRGGPPPRDDYDGRDRAPRRRKDWQEQEVGSIGGSSSSSSWSKPLLFGLLGALGCFVAALLICGPHILLIPSAPAAAPGTKVEVSAKADVMFVVDVTGSMDWAINGVNAGIQSFVDKFAADKIDCRVGLTIFRDEFLNNPDDTFAGVRGDPWTFTWRDGSTYTNNIDEYKEVLRKIRAGGGGDEPENCLEAMRLAAGKPQQADRAGSAIKVQILITDAHPKPWPFYEPNLNATKTELKAKNVRLVHIITHKHLQDEVYWKMWDKTKIKTKSGEETDVLGGAFYDLGEVSRNPSAMNSILTEFKKSIVEEARKEAGVASITGGAGATFEKSQSWRLWVASGLLFGVLAFGLALALIAGQRIYMRQSLLTGGAFVKALVPLGAGLIAGFLIDLLFTQFEMPMAVGIILRTLGWTLIGAVIGLSMAFFVPNLKWYKGLLGGVIGGFAGGLLFNLITLVTGAAGVVAGTLLGDLLGAIVIGFCIGVMVALAEVAFRRWWLEVRYGVRETRTVTLGTAPVTVGSDERRATVVVNNAPPSSCAPAQQRPRPVRGHRIGPAHRTGGRRQPQDRQRDHHRVQSGDGAASRPVPGLSNGQRVPLSDGLPLTAEELPGLQANSPTARWRSSARSRAIRRSSCCASLQAELDGTRPGRPPRPSIRG
ncbi:MAG: hypothetical protein U0793_17135 [Gemmataceae bacterium]